MPLNELFANKAASGPNTYRLVAFDPGAAATGWALFQLHCRAFTRPQNKVLANVIGWDCGEFHTTEIEQYDLASQLVYQAHYKPMPYNTTCHIISEDFELTQLIGGRNLLSPVRFNAVLDWECRKHGLTMTLQARQMRTAITRDRLHAFGFQGTWHKDEFSAMQHGLTWLRRIKQQANARPWLLSANGHANDHYDCACYEGYTCDIQHPTR